MSNKKYWDAMRSVPEDRLKRIDAGRLKGKHDINPQWRLEILTETFGPCGIGWYYKTIERWTEGPHHEGGTVSAHVAIELYIYDGEWSKPIEGNGGSMLIAKEKAGNYHSDEAFKMATTDAISVACKELGIGADVYMGHPFGMPGDKYAVEAVRLRACQTMDELGDAFGMIWRDLEGDVEGRAYVSKVKDECKVELS